MILRRGRRCGGLDARMQRMCPGAGPTAAQLHANLTLSNSLAGRKIAEGGELPTWKEPGGSAQGPS